jgi:tetratricopeptide (TPR) repeat protein/predicted 2-oxoglutarate/Fe(II)-dependent dioxygenase YbiX
LSFEDLGRKARSSPRDADILCDFAKAALDAGREEEAVPLIATAARAIGNHPRLWQWSALLHRALDDREAALAAMEQAARLAPLDKSIAHGRARIALEAGLPARPFYQAARRLAPGDADIALGAVAARVAEGDAAGAVSELDALLASNPGWIAGHEDLAQIRWTMGDRDGFIASYVRALGATPRDPALWQSLIILLTHAKLHEQALITIQRARGLIGGQLFLDASEAAIRSETGAVAEADALFARMSDATDVTIAVGKVRHWLRTGRIDPALGLVDAWIGTPQAASIWPYAATVWRLAGDPRWQWLEAQDGLVSVLDIADRLPPLPRLREVLLGLHRARGEQFNQSVRGGTQTDGILLARLEPEIRALRSALVDAVADHIARLPAMDPRHPTLAMRRDRAPRFAGSWSVRLRGSGHHAGHAHPAGWISSALYIALPDADPRNPEAGWLAFGQPPAELGVDLAPTRLVEPKPGRLVLFPSTMWHGTRPFAEGERLTVAFDVQPPPSPS